MRSILNLLAKVSIAALLFSAIGLLLIAIAVSPIGLRAAEITFGDQDWNTLSLIGQAYGAASAILAGLALLGIGGSLFMQVRESKTNREQKLRTLHLELLKMSLDDPDLMDCWGHFSDASDQNIRRQHLYVNLIFSHWQMVFEIGYLCEPELREMASSLFTGSIGRDFWLNSRQIRILSSTTPRAKRFHRIIDEEYRKAVDEEKGEN